MINEKDVKKIAYLSRINLSGKEEVTMQKELALILGYIEKLKEVDVENIFEAETVLGESNLREDEVLPEDCPDSGSLLGASPENEGGFVKVKKIIDEH